MLLALECPQHFGHLLHVLPVGQHLAGKPICGDYLPRNRAPPQRVARPVVAGKPDEGLNDVAGIVFIPDVLAER
jgi:hypothetical protein